MNHILYKKRLGKKMKDMSTDEMRVYYKLRHKSCTEAQKAATKARQQEWYSRNVEIAQAATHNNIVKKKYPIAAKCSDITNKSLTDWLKMHRGQPCSYCKEEGATHIDHRIPLSRGGTHTYNNIQIVCQNCNYAKRDMLEHEFIRWVKKISENIEPNSFSVV